VLPTTQIGIGHSSIDDLDEVGHSVSIGGSRFARCPIMDGATQKSVEWTRRRLSQRLPPDPRGLDPRGPTFFSLGDFDLGFR
jgi:hypothetical protein